jgi:hypothetical protein
LPLTDQWRAYSDAVPGTGRYRLSKGFRERYEQ